MHPSHVKQTKQIGFNIFFVQVWAGGARGEIGDPSAASRSWIPRLNSWHRTNAKVVLGCGPPLGVCLPRLPQVRPAHQHCQSCTWW